MSRPSYLHAFIDPLFFESIERYEPNEEDFLLAVKQMLRGEWVIRRGTVWFNCTPPEGRARDLPTQGWKIHVSCALTNAVPILSAVVPILNARDVSFKFALDKRVLTMMNGKNWGRQGAGKFVTIYPMDTAEFAELLEVLHVATRAFEGLYILSDRRYKDSKVLFYRYGGIRPVAVSNEKGEQASLLVSPTGERVPDERRPYFYLPSWVRDPFQNNDGGDPDPKDEQGRIALKEDRYRVKNVLGFSNSGGVYIADDTSTGDEVVIKEARPFVMFSEDSISLLKKEHRILSLIADRCPGLAPRPVDLFPDWEHWFLVQELIRGVQLTAFSAMNNITLVTNPSTEDAERFFRDFKGIFIQLAQTIKALHAQNIVFADLSPNNILVLSDPLRVRIIDFEGAIELGVDSPPLLFTPGFAYGDQMRGKEPSFESDYFSLGAVMHYFLAPFNQIFAIAPRARFTFLKAVVQDIGFPREVHKMIEGLIDNDVDERPKPDQVIEVLERDYQIRPPAFSVDGEKANPRYEDDVGRVCDYCLALADYRRKDRLFPAFGTIFETNPLSLAYGACGVAHAIKAMGREVPDTVLDWILQPTGDRAAYPPGLYVGLAGVAWALLDLGRPDDAKRILGHSHGHPLLYEAYDLFHGAPGWGLAHLRFSIELKDDFYLTKAVEAGEFLLKSCRTGDKGLYWERENEVPLGFAHGASGVSLFLLYLYLACQREEFLDAGVRALDYDLSRGVATRDGGLSWRRKDDSATIVYPYWRYGSAGVGAVLIRYHALLGDDRYLPYLEKIFLDLDRKYAVYPGLFIGLTGLGETLLDFHHFTGDDRFLRAAYRVATGLSLFGIERPEGLAFPGDTLTKICCDLGTGSAGVGRFLHRLVHRGPAPLLLDTLLDERLGPRTAERSVAVAKHRLVTAK